MNYVNEKDNDGAAELSMNVLGLRLDPFKLPPLNPQSHGKEGGRPNPAADWIQDAMHKLPSEAVVEIARSAARRQDLTVLQAMANAGAFNFLEDERKLAWHEAHYADDEIPLVAALACFIEGAQTTAPPEEVALSDSFIGTYPRVLTVSPEFRRFYAEQVKRFMNSFQSWIDGIDANVWPDVMDAQKKKVRATLCVLMAGSYAMDDEKLCMLISSSPFFMNIAVLRLNILGHSPSGDFFHDKNSSRVGLLYPVVLAHVFSSGCAYTVPESKGGGPLQGAASRGKFGGPVTLPALISSHCLVVSEASFRSLVKHLLSGKVPGFKYGIWSNLPDNSPIPRSNAGSDQNVQGSSYASAYLGDLVNSMCRGLGGHFDWYFKVGIEEGIHKINPTINRELVRMAIKRNDAKALELMGMSIDFSIDAEFDEKSIMAPGTAPRAHHLSLAAFDGLDGVGLAALAGVASKINDAVVLALIKAMRESGRLEEYFDHQATEPDNQDLLRLAKSSRNEVMIELLKGGLDLRRQNFSGLSPTEQIDQALVDHQTTAKILDDSQLRRLHHCRDLMRSWLVKISAHEAIGLMGSMGSMGSMYLLGHQNSSDPRG